MATAQVPKEAVDTPADVHLGWLSALWRKNQTWRDSLAKRAAHKALDIPEDDVNISVRKGMGWKELAAIAVVAGSALGGGYLLGDRSGDAQPTSPPAASPGAAPASQAPLRGKIRFWVDDKSGSTQLGEQQVQ